MKKAVFLIIACLFVISVAAVVFMKVASDPLSGCTTGIICIDGNDNKADLSKIELVETEEKKQVEFWIKEDGIHYRIETPEKDHYNLQLQVLGDEWNDPAFEGRKLIHNFSIFPYNDGMEIRADIFLRYGEKKGNEMADIQVKTSYKSRRFQAVQSEVHEKSFILSPRYKTEMSIL